MSIRCLHALILLLAAVLPSSGCRQSSPSRPNVMVIVIDTLRADRLGAYGSTRGLTPFLDQLAERGTVFRNAYATSSWTPPSIASLFTSRFPSQHKVVQGGTKLAENETTLAEKLAAHGYTTAGFTANLRLTVDLGYAQGFDRWIYDRTINPYSTIKPRGETLRRDSVEWADTSFAERQPAPGFLYLQYMEPHAPYDPPDPYRSRFGLPDAGKDEVAGANWKLVRLELSDLSDREGKVLESYYDAEVASVDAEIALLFAELERRKFLDNAIVLVTADHGEEFRDHGSFSHGSTLYNEMVHVPLLLLAPALVPGQVVERNVSLIDVAPTILALLDLPPEPRFDGRSLLPLLRKRRSLLDYVWRDEEAPAPVGDALVLLELAQPGWVDRRRHTAGLIEGRTKFLVNEVNQSTELFDLAVDARELSPRPSTEALGLAAALRNFQSSLRNPRQVVEEVQLDEALQERLRALGYSF